MKFRWKIFWLCILVYVGTLSITGIVVTNRSYNDLLKTEIDRSIKEEKNVHYNIYLYLITNSKLFKEKMYIKDYCNSIVYMFADKDAYLELYSMNYNKLASNASVNFKEPNDEIKLAAEKGKNFVLRRVSGRHYIFITDVIKTDSDDIIMSFIKDITYIDEHKNGQYLLFLQSGIIGFCIVAAIAIVMGKYVMRPIEKLSEAVRSITSGNFNERVKVSAKDEVGVLAVQFNIMAEEIEKKIEELQDQSERKQVFINNLTHELRTPLTSIIGYSDLMLSIKYDESIFQKSLYYINSEGKRMMKMVGSLMELILVKNESFPVEECSAMDLLSEVLDIIKVKADGKDVNIELIGLEQKITMNRDLIKEVLLNLIDNAINASNSGSNVSIESAVEGNKPTFIITDKGKGISRENIDKIVEPFYRIDSSRARKDGGMGLGLAICSEIVKGHGAKLTIESELGVGTSMKIIFQGEKL